MWIFMTPRARPDASPWPGRRLFALLDAVAWPALWLALIATAPFSRGVIGWTAMGLLGVVAACRIHRAIHRNERYWFTSARWGAPIAALIATGLAITLLA